MILSERKKDAVLVAIYTYAGLVLSFVFSSLFIRFDGGALYGIYAHSLAILSFIVVALGFGFQVGLVKINISIEKYKTIASTTLIFWTLVVSAGMLFYYFFFYENDFSDSFLLVITAGCATLTELVSVVWQWMKRIVAFKGYVAIRSAINIILVVLLINNFIQLDTFLILLTAFSISYLIFLIQQSKAVASLRKVVHVKENISEIKINLWNQSKYFWASLLAVAVYGKIGIVMLKFFAFSNAEIGRYAYVYTILAALLIFPSAIQTYLLRPLFAKDVDGKNIFRKIFPIYVVLGAICSFLFWKLIPIGIQIIIGKTPELQNVYYTFAPTILIVYIANILGMALMTEGKEKERAIIQWGSAISHVLLTIILIPSYDLMGAALATTGSYFFLLCGFLYVVLKENIWNVRSYRTPILLCTISPIAYYFNSYIILLPAIIASGSLIYQQFINRKSAQ